MLFRTRDPSPGPPSVGGMNRARLPSIDADDWGEENDENAASKNSGSRSRGSRGQRTGDTLQRGARRDDAFRSTVRAGNTASARGRRGMDAYGATGFASIGRIDSSSGDDHNMAIRGRSRNIEPIRRTDSDSYFSSDFSDDDESDMTPSQSSVFSASSFTDDGSQNLNERTSLLPPPGISSHEPHSRQANRRSSGQSRRSRDRRDRRSRRHREHRHRDDSRGGRRNEGSRSRGGRRRHRSDGRDHQRHRHREQEYNDDSDDYELSASSASSSQHRRWARKKDRLLEREKARLIAQWKAEEDARRQQEAANLWYRRFGRWSSDRSRGICMATSKFLTLTGELISNMPLTINAVALAIVTLGVVWFKFAEENLDSCMPVHFHSPQCT